MTHWTDIPNRTVPAPDDSWDRPAYDDLAALTPTDLLTAAWKLLGAYQDVQFGCLDLAQDLSFEFEVCDYGNVKDEYRHIASTERQERGIRYTQHAYELAGFDKGRRQMIADAATELMATGHTELGATE